MLEIVWRNPQPPLRRKLRIAAVRADESTAAPMWIISYHSINETDWPENEYQLLVNRNPRCPIAV